jgi:hypothetical protein
MKLEEEYTSDICALCGWPINKPITKKEAAKLISGIIDWLNNNKSLTKNLEKKIEKFGKEELYICRYDFFYLIKDIIECENEEIAKKFENEVASKYEFYGGIIS